MLSVEILAPTPLGTIEVIELLPRFARVGEMRMRYQDATARGYRSRER